MNLPCTSNYSSSTSSCWAGCSLKHFPFALSSDVFLFSYMWWIFRIVGGPCHKSEQAQLQEAPRKPLSSWHSLLRVSPSKVLTLPWLLCLSTAALAASRLDFNCAAPATLQRATKGSCSQPDWHEEMCCVCLSWKWFFPCFFPCFLRYFHKAHGLFIRKVLWLIDTVN